MFKTSKKIIISGAIGNALEMYDYVIWGLFSVYLLLFIRIIQVFSVGSEYISSVSLLIESCEKNKKGYFGSWAAFGINAGMLISSLTGALVLYLMDINILPKWGWRLAFVLAFLTIMFGFWIRRSVPESQEFISNNARSEQRSLANILVDTTSLLKQQYLESFIVFSLVLFGVVTTMLIFIYAPIHMVTANSFSHTQAFMINSLGLGVVTTLIPFMGIASDSHGSTRIISAGTITLMLFIVPYFSCLTTSLFSQVLLFHCLMAIPCAGIFAVTPVFITDIFPHSVICSIANLIYSIAAARTISSYE